MLKVHEEKATLQVRKYCIKRPKRQEWCRRLKGTHKSNRRKRERDMDGYYCKIRGWDWWSSRIRRLSLKERWMGLAGDDRTEQEVGERR